MAKAQGSTEYLMVMAVVILVALVVVSILGGFPGFGLSGSEQQSRNYWESATPFSIVNIKVSGNSVQMDVKNGFSQRLDLTNITFDGADIGAGPRIFGAGQTITLAGTIPAFNCASSQYYEFTQVVFAYRQGPVAGLTQTGDKPLIGKCS